MVQLRLDAEDLARLRIGPVWGPLSEAMFSLAQLPAGCPNGLVDGWRRRVQQDVGRWADPLRLLMGSGPFVDLHTVVGQAGSVEQSLESLLGAADTQMREELGPVLQHIDARTATSVRSWLNDLVRADRHALRDLAERFERYTRVAVLPYWEGIRSHLEAERAYRARIMAEDGIDGLLSSLHPRITWRPPMLHVGTGGAAGDRVMALRGRSLLLVPSAFGLGAPHVLTDMHDTSLPHLLVYPAVRDVEDALAVWAHGSRPRSRALGLLLGQTRAAALDAITDVCNTTELGRRIGVSPATASHHVGVLRSAGLINTRRHGSAVYHSLTPLGARLLTGDGTGDDQALRH